jgi:hypothetical protein
MAGMMAKRPNPKPAEGLKRGVEDWMSDIADLTGLLNELKQASK